MTTETLTEAAAGYPSLDEVLRKPWWKTVDVAVYLDPDAPSVVNTRRWMGLHGVRRSKTHKLLTCREWVDAALNRTR